MTKLLEKQEQSREVSEPRSNSATPSCSGRTELFFSESTKDMRAAQVICASCPVRVPCLEQARERPPFAGVWGGVIFVNGEELLLKRGRGRPRKSEELDNARVLKALSVAASHDEQESPSGSLVRHIA